MSTENLQIIVLSTRKSVNIVFPVLLMPDHSSILNPTNTSGGAPGVAGTLDVTVGKEGEVLAQTLSFCLQGHSCLMVAPTASSGTDAVSVLQCHPVRGIPTSCDGSFRQRVGKCPPPSTQSYHWGGYSVPVGGKGLHAKVKKWTCSIEIYPQHQLGRHTGYWICLFSLSVCRVKDLDLSDINRKEK